MAGKPPAETGRSQRAAVRDEAAATAPRPHLGCGTLVVLFLLVATAGKFLPHRAPGGGDPAPAAAAKGQGEAGQRAGKPVATAKPPASARERSAPPAPRPGESAGKTVPAESGARVSEVLGSVWAAFERFVTPVASKDSAAATTASASGKSVPRTESPPAGTSTAPPRTGRPAAAAAAGNTGNASAGRAAQAPVAGPAPPLPPGGKPVVFNSPWDQSVEQVERYLKRRTHDPDSIEFIEWGKVQAASGGYQVRCTFRSKNVLGKVATQSRLFVLDARGEVVDVRD